MRIFHAAVLLILAGGVLVFCLQNLETATVKFLGWSMSLPLPALVLIVYLAGMLSGWAVLSYLRRSIHRLTEKRKE